MEYLVFMFLLGIYVNFWLRKIVYLDIVFFFCSIIYSFGLFLV